MLLNVRGRFLVSARVFLIRCLGIVSGLSLYLLLPIRASFDPPVNWGNASTLDGFIWLVSGQLYHDYLFSLSRADIIQRLRSFAGLWLVFAIWMAYGLQDLFELTGNRFRRRAAFAALLFAVLRIRIPFSLRHVDVSKDSRAPDFIDSTLHNIPKDSLVFIDGDEQIFSLRYAQFALHRRTDIVLVASDLLPYKWYVESLDHTYPNANIPILDILQSAQFSAANPDRVVCYISADRLLKCP